LDLAQLEVEDKGWDNHEDTFEETLRRELVASRAEINLLKEDLKQLTKAYYKILRNKMEHFVEKLRKELENDEGNVKSIYLCTESHPTFGIGHLITSDDPEHGKPVGTEVSEERVISAFEDDISVTISDCTKIFRDWNSLPEEARLVTANMCFQLGMPNLKKFKKMISACNRGKWTDMASEMRNSRWHKQTTARAERLIKRILDLDQMGS